MSTGWLKKHMFCLMCRNLLTSMQFRLTVFSCIHSVKNLLTEDFIDSWVDSEGHYDNSGKNSRKYWQLFHLTAAIFDNYLHLSFTFSKVSNEFNKESSQSHCEHFSLKLKGQTWAQINCIPWCQWQIEGIHTEKCFSSSVTVGKYQIA